MKEIFRINEDQEFSVAVIGGGISGSTVAIKLAQHGLNVTLFEASDSLVNGSPFCHLHAGGNLYREISDEQCLTLLEECLETIKMYPDTVNARPTLIAVPICDNGEPNDLLSRLQIIQAAYARMVHENPCNQLLGLPDDYFQTFTKEQVEKLSSLDNPSNPVTLEEWLIPVTKHLNLKELKFPLIMVKEFGWSTLRLAATVQLFINGLKNCCVHLKARVTDVKLHDKQWHIQFQKYNPLLMEYETKYERADYLINACGYQTGFIDDMIPLTCKRMAEFKASYLSYWKDCSGKWPGVIIHGKRGTPSGMIQLTPYPGKVFQLHCMTQDITLFEDGLVTSTDSSSQPRFSKKINKMLSSCWEKCEVEKRTTTAIDYAAQYILGFKTAICAGPALFGAQQIPGSDPNLRTGGVIFEGDHYARMEIIKASSAVTASIKVLEYIQKSMSASHNKKRLFLKEMGEIFLSNAIFDNSDSMTSGQDCLQVNNTPSSAEIAKLAISLARHRGYPKELAKTIPLHSNEK